MGYTAVRGYCLLPGLQVDTDTQERQSSPLLCSTYLAKEGTKTSPLLSLHPLFKITPADSPWCSCHRSQRGHPKPEESWLSGISRADLMCWKEMESQWAVSKDEIWSHRVLCQDHLLAQSVSHLACRTRLCQDLPAGAQKQNASQPSVIARTFDSAAVFMYQV